MSPGLRAGTLAQEIGWVLSNAREHGVQEEWHTAAKFAGSLTPHVHRAQIGRWESGATTISYLQVREYERLLELRPGHLLTMIDILSRDRQPIQSAPHLVPPPSETWWEEANDLIDKADSPQRMSSHDWWTLTSLLGTNPDAFVRRRDWAMLLRRCSTEGGLRTGLSYLERSEAVLRLAGHQRATEAVVELADEVLRSSSSPIYIETTLVLCANPAADRSADLLLGHLATPSCEAALVAAYWGVSTLAKQGRLDGERARRAGMRAVGQLQESGGTERVLRAAASLVRHLQPPERRELVESLRGTARSRIGLLIEGGAALHDSELSQISHEISDRLAVALGPQSVMAPTLQRLIADATTLSSEEGRGDALRVLMLAPQGAVIGRTYAAGLRWALANAKPVLVDEALSVLSWLIQPVDLPRMLELALDPPFDATRGGQVAVAVGNVRPDAECVEAGLTEEVVVGRVCDAALEAMADPSREAGPTARGLLYVLGMYGRFDVIEGLREPAAGESVAPEWAAAIASWLEVPEWARPRPDMSEE